MENYNKLRKPPQWALKTIEKGRLKGKSDINPQWRYEAMTEVYGPCGTGWKFTVDKKWSEQGADGTVFAFADVSLYVKDDGGWSEPIPGSGGSQLVAKETGGLHSNDEAYKMAVTDALSVAMKMIGVAADIYAGLWDGSKYIERKTDVKPGKPPEPKAKPDPLKKELYDKMIADGLSKADAAEFFTWMNVSDDAGVKTAITNYATLKADWEKAKGN